LKPTKTVNHYSIHPHTPLLVHIGRNRNQLLEGNIKSTAHSHHETPSEYQFTKALKGATGLYKPVGGAGASFCIISNMLHTRDLFSKLRNIYK